MPVPSRPRGLGALPVPLRRLGALVQATAVHLARRARGHQQHKNTVACGPWTVLLAAAVLLVLVPVPCCCGLMARVWDSSQWNWERGVLPVLPQCGEGDGSMELHPAAAGVPRRERQPVRIVEDCTPDHFKREIAQTREPALLRGLPLGPCLDLWTPEHLMRQGGTKEVSVHVSAHDRMDFITKNFKYHTLPFDELIRRAAYGWTGEASASGDTSVGGRACGDGQGTGDEPKAAASSEQEQPTCHAAPARKARMQEVQGGARGEEEQQAQARSAAEETEGERGGGKEGGEETRTHGRGECGKGGSEQGGEQQGNVSRTKWFIAPHEKYYLRALGADPRKSVANIAHDFPDLANEVHLPNLCDDHQVFSSVLRVGSPGIHLWTHYDVMDNALVQVSGRKRVVLYPPEDVDHMYMVGDKSAVVDIDSPDYHRYPLFRHARPFEVFMQAGEVLFIPALWFHNVVSLDFSVAVNVFWRRLPAEMYDPKDTYGNRDLVAANRAMQQAGTMIKSLQALPPTECDFFARRIVQLIKDKTYVKE